MTIKEGGGGRKEEKIKEKDSLSCTHGTKRSRTPLLVAR
jgi:hypothetical protein